MTTEKRMGTKCHICTGCGACLSEAARQGAIHVVTAGGSGNIPAMPFVYTEHTQGMRLVTVDIGTTTIAMQLYRTDGSVEAEYSCVNPQVRYGADVLSRIQAASNSGAGEETAQGRTAGSGMTRQQAPAQDMKCMAEETLQEGIVRFQQKLSYDESLFMVLAGNTTMVYLLMGYDTDELGHAPFEARHLEPIETTFFDVPCVIFPGLSAFVGGDIAAGMYACELKERQEVTLLIDLGTNGEMVLGNRERQTACATAAGPAFEGGVNRGIWGADMVHLLAVLRRKNLVDETGLLADEYFDEGILIGNVHVTQESIRAIQLAKGAIGAGIRILGEEYGCQSKDAVLDGGGIDYAAIDRVVLAGGFGYYLNPEDAACIGLLPNSLVSRTVAGGNTALAGALRLGRRILQGEIPLSKGDGRFAERIARLLNTRETEVLNLAEQVHFEELYLENMELRNLDM